MALDFDDFDWDEGNFDKCGKHGVSVDEIEELLLGDPMVAEDPLHSQSEPRFRAIGRCANGRHVFVAYTLRNRDGLRFIRPISARYMHLKEVRFYERYQT
ncbi:MAG: hypothetical protein CMP81_23540 [Fulvimarina sp.]|nr:hypothetical protein [Fulvimarina sp.]